MYKEWGSPEDRMRYTLARREREDEPGLGAAGELPASVQPHPHSSRVACPPAHFFLP